MGAKRSRWTSTQWALLAFGLNAACLLVLFVNLLTGNAWWEAAVAVAAVCLGLGGAAAFQTRRLRIKERYPLD
ncbi:hypothetical protein GCM10010988_40650 [Cnuibacter physcomitrellae]|nr:hypothetical protein GCM10010988_40650 [Cnuibacter physcomitrellae]